MRLVTESIGHVRSVTVGRLGDARIAPRGGRRERRRPFRRAHALQGHDVTIGARDRADDRFDWRTARRVHREGIRRLLHQGPGRASAGRDRSVERHAPSAGARARGRAQGAAGHPRRDQDGRGCARRPGPRALRAAVLVEAPARPPDSGHARNGDVVRFRRAAAVFQPELRRAASRSSRRRATSSTGRSRDLIERGFEQLPRGHQRAPRARRRR